MEKPGLGCLIIASLIGANWAEATYIIKLKNGNEYLTNRYWHRGSQILFDAEGGIFGVDKVLVRNIEKTDKVIKLITPASLAPPDRTQVEAKEDDSRTNKDSPPPDKKTPAIKDENDPIYKEFSFLRGQSANLPIMSRTELEDYVTKIAKLISTIQKERKTNQFLQEYSELNALANRVEETIKALR